MAGDKIRQIARLKQLLTRWKQLTLLRNRTLNDTVSSPLPPSGFLFIYVGPERQRFVIPARFLNLPIFASLLKQSEEEFGFIFNGGLVLPCQVGFFNNIVNYLYKDENKFGKFSVQDFQNIISDLGFDPCKEKILAFTPLLQKTKV
ncbi:hypothetical protein TanjilG_04840 [Lupinus angustifolius]|uniref:Uncharacterized protein n=1 Tax=Lupinus angustifolius TaxID=3871 RepID=A0A4P1QS70_LUPAN|nr:PREDICTED: auxin-responsive protein SAUR21-like [Lupinus angustifolius]OIV93608.1 hypothetical protein TanjilG_04840 [Lupinus angustifolius]